ncbi:MAG: hypothetical protein JWM85_1600, partial [Acidimicrobiaceae bacterium]|nr:hypothetical protein [Acidimicrobiaceae bacterium]
MLVLGWATGLAVRGWLRRVEVRGPS